MRKNSQKTVIDITCGITKIKNYCPMKKKGLKLAILEAKTATIKKDV